MGSKILQILLALFFPLLLLGQGDSLRIQNEILLDRLSAHDKQIDDRIKAIENDIKLIPEKIIEQGKKTEESIKAWLSFFITVIGGIITVIIALIGFFGTSFIKERIKDKINNYVEWKTNEKLDKKLTEEYISNKINEKGAEQFNVFINGIQEKSQETSNRIEKLVNDVNFEIEEKTKTLSNETENLMKQATSQVQGIELELATIIKNAEMMVENILTEELIKSIIEAKGEDAINKVIEDAKKRMHEVVTKIEKDGQEKVDSLVNGLITQMKSNNSSEKNSADATIFFELATQEPDLKTRINLYTKIIELTPNAYEAYFNRAFDYFILGDTDSQIKDLKRGIELNPNFIWGYVNLAHALMAIGNITEAEHYLDLGLSIDSQHYGLESSQGSILFRKGKYVEALEKFNKSVAKAPTDPFVYFARGFFYLEKKPYQPDLAIKDFLKAIELGDKSAQTYCNVAVSYRRLKQFDKAFKYLDLAKKQDPNAGNIYGTQALIFADQGKIDLFYHYLELALNKNCNVWEYLDDPGFDNYRNTPRLNSLLEKYKHKE